LSRRGRIAVVALIAALLLGLGGCGSSSSSSSSSSSANGSPTTQGTTSFAKTKFVLHAGLAFGAFHHFIYKPYKDGKLSGFTHKLALLKAGLAGLFAYHEVKLALVDAKSSPLLSKLLSPLTALSDKLQALGTQLKGGTIDKTAIEGANTQLGVADAAARAAGQPVSDALPSAAQLAGG
jgi:hypothetical protein